MTVAAPVISQFRRAWAALLVAVMACVAASCSTTWKIEESLDPLTGHGPRLEITANDTWVGQITGRSGVHYYVDTYDVRYFTNCHREWVIVYPPAVSELLPPAGADMSLSVSRGSAWAETSGQMASNGEAVAVFVSSPNVEELLLANLSEFSEGRARILVTKADGSRVSVSDVAASARKHRWLPEFDDACKQIQKPDVIAQQPTPSRRPR